MIFSLMLLTLIATPSGTGLSPPETKAVKAFIESTARPPGVVRRGSTAKLTVAESGTMSTSISADLTGTLATSL